MNCLVTGCAGFIGFHISLKLLLNKNYKVFGVDNLDNYYDKKLKKDRLKVLIKNKNFFFKLLDINNIKNLENIFKKNKLDIVIHLAAQPGVNYSFKNPSKYIKNNINGFFNVLDLSSKHKIKNFLYASSSSVYGNNKNFTNIETDKTDTPLSVYSATKKTNELIAYSYSNFHNIQTIGLRFFTVYGKYARPDMFFSKLASAIKKNNFIELYNNGNLFRDFTYIDDVSSSIYKLIRLKIKKEIPAEIFNIGNSNSVKLTKILNIFEDHYQKKTNIIHKELSKGELKKTNSSLKKLRKYIIVNKFKNIEDGLKVFLKWHDEYYK